MLELDVSQFARAFARSRRLQLLRAMPAGTAQTCGQAKLRLPSGRNCRLLGQAEESRFGATRAQAEEKHLPLGQCAVRQHVQARSVE